MGINIKLEEVAAWNFEGRAMAVVFDEGRPEQENRARRDV